MRLEEIAAHPDDVMVTVGSQQGLDLMPRIFCNEGDVVLVESFTYLGALGAMRGFCAKPLALHHKPRPFNSISPRY